MRKVEKEFTFNYPLTRLPPSSYKCNLGKADWRIIQPSPTRPLETWQYQHPVLNLSLDRLLRPSFLR